jgi:hypothetical protein
MNFTSFTEVKPSSHASRRVLAVPPKDSSHEAVVTVEELQHQMHARRSRQARQLSIYFARIFLLVLVM